jgi:hypothetical protein
MAYASFADVQARAGRFAPALSVAGKQPSQADVEEMLSSCAAEIDAAISAAGIDPAGLSQAAKDALRDLNAYGATARALAAADLGAEATDLVTYAQRIWADGIAAIIARRHPALVMVEATGGATAGSFWGDEPTYGRPETMEAERLALRGTSLAPVFEKGQSL